MLRHFITTIFVVSTSIVLLLVGIAKLWLGFGSMNDLFVLDPIFGIKFRFMIQAAGVVEVGFGLACLVLCQIRQQKGLLLIAWLATSLAIYRLGLWLMDWMRPCDCMGYLTKALHLSPQAADNTMKAFLVYMLAGSYAGLFWLWKEGRNKSNEVKKIVDLGGDGNSLTEPSTLRDNTLAVPEMARQAQAKGPEKSRL